MVSTKSSVKIEYCDQIGEEIYLYGDSSANSEHSKQQCTGNQKNKRAFDDQHQLLISFCMEVKSK